MGKMSFDEIIKLDGGYWKYHILDFYYLKNHYFPTKEMYDILKKEFPILCKNYPSSQKEIAKSLAKWKDEDYFNENNLIVGNGSSELITNINYLVNNSYIKTTISIPTYNEYLKIDRKNLFYSGEENKFKIDVDELIKSIKESSSSLLIIVNPNNPSGNILTRKDIKKILYEDKDRIHIIIDEAFIDFSKKNSIQDLVQEFENLTVINSCTKTVGLSGLRLGYMLTTDKYIKKEIKEMLPRWNINSITERIIELFLEFKGEYWKSIKKTIDDRNYLFNELKKIGFLEPYESHANFILCKTKINAKELAKYLFYKHKILIRPGLIQENLKGDYYCRIGVNTKENNDKLISALKETRGEKI